MSTRRAQDRSAADYLPQRLSLRTLRKAAAACQGCDLYRRATQTVFGEGSADARVVLVGEQPGDREDIQGRPFVGPAGRVLDQACAAAGLPRDEIYVTNAVKHFKFEPRGKRRLHKKPSAREMAACRPWIEAEIGLIQPEVLVCLGATAAQSLLGREFRITKHRGEFIASEWCDQTMATWHPSAVLRAPDDDRRHAMLEEFTNDLRRVVRSLASPA